MNNHSHKPSSEAEEVVLCLNDHWVVLCKHMAVEIVFFIISIVLFAFAVSLSDAVTLSLFLFLAGYLMLLFSIHHFFVVLLHWELSNWIITMRRVIDFQNIPYVENDVTFVNVDEIHEIEKKKHGFWANFWDYGEVHINLAAAPQPVVFRNIPHPGKFTNLIESIRSKKPYNEIDLKALQEIYGRRYRYVIRQK